MKIQTMNLNDLTIGDAVKLENYLGITIEKYQTELNAYQSIDGKPAEREGNPPMRLLIPMIWLAGRADDPSFTIEDAEKVRFSELEPPDDDPGTSIAEANASSGRGPGKGKKGRKPAASTGS